MTQFLLFSTHQKSNVNLSPFFVARNSPESPEIAYFRDYYKQSGDFFTVSDEDNRSPHDLFDNAFQAIQEEGHFKNTKIHNLLRILVDAGVTIYMWYGSEYEDLESTRKSDELMVTVESQLSESPGEVYAVYWPSEKN